MKFFTPRLTGALLFAAMASLVPTQSHAVSTTRVSVASDGTQGELSSVYPSISADGRYVAFSSPASNLVAGDTNGSYDIFMRDLQSNTTQRISVATDGTQGDKGSDYPSISADGRYIAFSSYATNLVAGDTNGSYDIFMRDLQSNTTQRISVASDGTQANSHSYCYSPIISADGRYVAFYSYATNLVAGDTNGVADVFVRDLQSNTTQRISVATDGTQGDSASNYPSISRDGRYVVFASDATNLVAGDTNNKRDIFMRDLQSNTTQRISVATDGTQANNYCYHPSISGDGRYVAFYSNASNLVAGDTNGSYDIFMRDLQSNTTQRISVATDGTQGDKGSDSPSISGDGRYVAFSSDTTNLVAGDTNGVADVFVRDLQSNTTQRISVATDGTQGDSASGYPYLPSISGDGRYIAFYSNATNLVAGDTNAKADIFVRDLSTSTVTVSGHTFTFAPSADFASVVKTSLPDVTVTLKNSGGQTRATVASDNTGSYSFTGLDAGDYSVEAQLIRSGQPTLNLAPASRAVTIVEADVAVPKFSLYSIFGVVKGPRNDGTTGPLSNVVVSLKSSGTVIATKTTTTDGRFTFGKLAAGTYSLNATKTGLTFINPTGLVLPGTVAPIAPALKQNIIGTRNAPQEATSGAKF